MASAARARQTCQVRDCPPTRHITRSAARRQRHARHYVSACVTQKPDLARVCRQQFASYSATQHHRLRTVQATSENALIQGLEIVAHRDSLDYCALYRYSYLLTYVSACVTCPEVASVVVKTSCKTSSLVKTKTKTKTKTSKQDIKQVRIADNRTRVKFSSTLYTATMY